MGDAARLLVTGSREYTDARTCAAALDEVAGLLRAPGGPPPILVHGSARGLDSLADRLARARGWPVEGHPADWARRGRRAGFVRNAEMVASGADLCLAFPLGALLSGTSRGTWGCATAARAAGIPTLLVWAGSLCAFDRDARGVLLPDTRSRDLLGGASRSLTLPDHP